MAILIKTSLNRFNSPARLHQNRRYRPRVSGNRRSNPRPLLFRSSQVSDWRKSVLLDISKKEVRILGLQMKLRKYRHEIGKMRGEISIFDRQLEDLHGKDRKESRRIKKEKLGKRSGIKKRLRLIEGRHNEPGLEAQLRQITKELLTKYEDTFLIRKEEEIPESEKNALPGIDLSNLKDNGDRLRKTFPNGRILIANRGQYATHAYFSLLKLGFDVYLTATAEDIQLGTRPLDLIIKKFGRDHIIEIDNYNNIASIIDKAKQKGIEGILPGYGFKSESPEFIWRAQDAGIHFIGSNRESVEKAGDKVRFKNTLKRHNLDPIDGPSHMMATPEGNKEVEYVTFHFDLRTEDNGALLTSLSWAVDQFAAGKSILIKATEAGGGKGIREVRNPREFFNALAGAFPEAKSFVDKGASPPFTLEDLITDVEDPKDMPLHIEAQIVAHRRPEGESTKAPEVQVFLRNCSIQNSRRQKMVEIAVPNKVPEDMAATMIPQNIADEIRKYAQRATEAVGYDNVATIEFLYQPKSQKFFPLEMNTRIQVEALVTSLQEGIDLNIGQILAFAGYSPPEINKTFRKSRKNQSRKKTIMGQVRLTGDPGTLEGVHLVSDMGVTPFTFLRKGTQVSPNFDAQIGAYLVEAPDVLTLLLKMRAAVTKTQFPGKSSDPKEPYQWHEASILRALDKAIDLQIKGETPHIETIAEMELNKRESEDLMGITSFGGKLDFPITMAGVPVKPGLRLEPGEVVATTEAMKQKVEIRAPGYVEVVSLLQKPGTQVTEGTPVIEFKPVSDHLFLEDRLDRVRGFEISDFLTAVINQVPVKDQSFAKIFERALKGERLDRNVEWLEVKEGETPEIIQDIDPVLVGSGKMFGLKIYLVREDRDIFETGKIKPEWFLTENEMILFNRARKFKKKNQINDLEKLENSQAYQDILKKFPFDPNRQRIIITSSKEGLNLKESALNSLAGEKPTSRWGKDLFISPIQELAYRLLDGNTEFSTVLRDLIFEKIEPYESNVLGSSLDHYTPIEMVGEWIREGRVDKVEEIPSNDKALYMARLTLCEELGGMETILIAQKMGGAEVNNGMGTEASFNDMVHVLRKPEFKNTPVIFVANTIGADPAREIDLSRMKLVDCPDGKRLRVDNINHGIAEAVLAAAEFQGPVFSIVENGASGGALPFLIANHLVAGERTGNAAVIGAKPASVILGGEFRGREDKAANFMQMNAPGLLKFGAIQGTFPQPLRDWGLHHEQIFHEQLEQFVQYLNRIKWFASDAQQRIEISRKQQIERWQRFSNFGVQAGYLEENRDVVTLTENDMKLAPSQAETMARVLESPQATHRRNIGLIADIIETYPGVREIPTNTGDISPEEKTILIILDIFDEATSAKNTARYNYRDRAAEIERLVKIPEGRFTQAVHDLFQEARKGQRGDIPPVDFAYGEIVENGFNCPITSKRVEIPTEYNLFGLFGGVVENFYWLPQNWVAVKKEGPLDFVYTQEKTARDQRLKGSAQFPGQTLGAFICEDRLGERFVFSSPHYLTGSAADVTRKYSLLALLARELEIPLLGLKISGGMKIDHKKGALPGMSDMILNYELLHRRIAELIASKPLFSHWEIVPYGGAFGGDTASSTARTSELSWRYLTAPAEKDLPQCGGLGFFRPETRIGFAGPMIVEDKILQDKMIAQQRAKNWIDSFYGTRFNPLRILEERTLAGLIGYFRETQKQQRTIYLEALDNVLKTKGTPIPMAYQSADGLSLERIQEKLPNQLLMTLGNNIHFMPATESTQTQANESAAKGMSEGLCVIADQQTQGRGRHEHSWESPQGLNLYCSVLIRPQVEDFTLARANEIQFMASLAAARTLKKICGIEVNLKWPNDIHAQGKKLGGIILTSSSSDGNKLDSIVMGLGLNLNATKEDFSPEVKDLATSAYLLTGKMVDRAQFIASLLEEMDILYAQLKNDGFESIRQEWQENAPLMVNHPVRLDKVLASPGNLEIETVEGMAQGIDASGKLILERNDGSRISIIDCSRVSIIDGTQIL